MGLLEAFGAAVRRHRQEVGLSQEALAFEAGLDRTYVSGIERGRRNPSLLTIELLTVAMGVPLDALFTTVVEIAGPIRRGAPKATGARPQRRRARRVPR